MVMKESTATSQFVALVTVIRFEARTSGMLCPISLVAKRGANTLRRCWGLGCGVKGVRCRLHGSESRLHISGISGFRVWYFVSRV